MFGISVTFVGVSLTYGIVMGLAGSVGSLMPLCNPKEGWRRPRAPWIMLGVAVMIAGVGLAAAAGVWRDRIQARAALQVGLAIAIACGVLSALLNVGFVNAAPVAEAAGGRAAHCRATPAWPRGSWCWPARSS